MNYDCAALAIAASMCTDVKYEKARCAYNPLRKIMICKGDSIDFAAHANVYLGVGKLEDNYRDEKNILSLIGAKFFSSAKKKAKKNLGVAADEMDRYLAELYELEKSQSDDLDKPCVAFANSLSALMEGAPSKSTEQDGILKRIAFNLGRWIYLIDAYDDLEKDQKSKSYNVLLSKFILPQAAREQKDRISFSLIHSLMSAAEEAEKLPNSDLKPILLNIIDLGAHKKTTDILKDKTEGTDESV